MIVSELKSRMPELHQELRSKGVYLHDIQNLATSAKLTSRGKVFRVTIDIPASQISKSGDVRAIFGDGDCELLPAIVFIDKQP